MKTILRSKFDRIMIQHSLRQGCTSPIRALTNVQALDIMGFGPLRGVSIAGFRPEEGGSIAEFSDFRARGAEGSVLENFEDFQNIY